MNITSVIDEYSIYDENSFPLNPLSKSNSKDDFVFDKKEGEQQFRIKAISARSKIKVLK